MPDDSDQDGDPLWWIPLVTGSLWVILALIVFQFDYTTVSALSILLQGAAGTFNTTSAYTTDSLPRGIAVTDLNGDRKLDLVTANAFADDVFVFGGNGPGTFGTPTSYVVGDGPKWLTAADFKY